MKHFCLVNPPQVDLNVSVLHLKKNSKRFKKKVKALSRCKHVASALNL